MQKKHFAPEAAEVHPAISFDLAASSKTAGTSSRPGQSTLCKAKGCDRKLSIRMNDHKPKPFKAFAAAACQRGWKFDEALDGFLCPEHATQPEPVEPKRKYERRQPEEPMTTSTQKESVSAVREPTPDQRRAIFKEIDDCYDVPNRRYISGHSDKGIGEKLHVPWAWVAAVRDQNFGPAGPDPKIGEIDRELKALKQRADKLETDAIAAYETAEKAADKLRADIAALEAKLAVLV